MIYYQNVCFTITLNEYVKIYKSVVTQLFSIGADSAVSLGVAAVVRIIWTGDGDGFSWFGC